MRQNKLKAEESLKNYKYILEIAKRNHVNPLSI